jgi:ABC-type Fe3+ transport system permease subunit
MEETIGEEIVKEFFGDMPVARFIAMYVFAFFGMFLFFLGDVRKAIKHDKSTSNKWNWKDFFAKGSWRLIGNSIFMIVGVLFYTQITKMVMLNAEFVVPPIIDGPAAFLMGTRADLYVQRFLGWGRNGL